MIIPVEMPPKTLITTCIIINKPNRRPLSCFTAFKVNINHQFVMIIMVGNITIIGI